MGLNHCPYMHFTRLLDLNSKSAVHFSTTIYPKEIQGLKSVAHSVLANGNFVVYQLFQNEWKSKYSESPLNVVSESSLICLPTPNASQDTAIEVHEFSNFKFYELVRIEPNTNFSLYYI